MNEINNDVWDRPDARQFSELLVDIADVVEMQNLLRDVMTEKEIVEISARLRAAQMLSEDKKYTEIIKVTKLSSRTVARISQWMNNGTGGYASALKNHAHLPPAQAD